MSPMVTFVRLLRGIPKSRLPCDWLRGAGRDVVGISRGAVSEQLMVSDQAARSIG
jgi:hypothetical protein